MRPQWFRVFERAALAYGAEPRRLRAPATLREATYLAGTGMPPEEAAHRLFGYGLDPRSKAMSKRRRDPIHVHASSRRVRAEEGRYYGGPHARVFRVRHADHGTEVTGPGARGFVSFLGRRGVHDPRKLTYKESARIPSSLFALPSRRKLKLVDKKRVANAAARVVQMLKRGTLSPSEFRTARARIVAAACRFGVERTCRLKLRGADALLRRRGRARRRRDPGPALGRHRRAALGRAPARLGQRVRYEGRHRQGHRVRRE